MANVCSRECVWPFLNPGGNLHSAVRPFSVAGGTSCGCHAGVCSQDCPPGLLPGTHTHQSSGSMHPGRKELGAVQGPLR